MSDHHHSEGPFAPPDPDDPLTMMGVAMVGMTLEDMVEQEERERRAGSASPQPATQDSGRSDLASFMPVVVVIIVAVGIMLLCGLLASTSGF